MKIREQKLSVVPEVFFLTVAILFYGKVWIWPIDVEQQIELYKPFGMILRVAEFLVFPYVIVVNKSVLKTTIRRPTAIFCLVLAICLLSNAWSSSLYTSFQNSVDILSLFLSAIVVASRMETAQVVRVIFWISLSVIFLSVIFSLLHFTFAIMGGVHAGDWRGLFGHKNNYGEFVLFSSIISLSMAKKIGIRLFWRTAFFVLSLISLIMAQSSTSFTLFIVAVAIIIIWSNFGETFKNRIIAVLFLIALSIVTINVLEYVLPPVIEALGKDLTFTGRVGVWSYYYDLSMQSPWIGYGYGAFFTDQNITQEARTVLFRLIRSPHNGYIAVALGIGWPGLVFYIIWHVSVFWRGFTSGRDQTWGMIVALSVCYAIFSLFEVSGAAMISIGLLFMLTLSAAVFREADASAKKTIATGKAARGSTWQTSEVQQ